MIATDVERQLEMDLDSKDNVYVDLDLDGKNKVS